MVTATIIKVRLEDFPAHPPTTLHKAINYCSQCVLSCFPALISETMLHKIIWILFEMHQQQQSFHETERVEEVRAPLAVLSANIFLTSKF
jgi:hypothetical protein